RLFLRRVIADYIPVAPPIQLDPGKLRVAALVGPTGVGKTTTVAKLAAYAPPWRPTPPHPPAAPPRRHPPWTCSPYAGSCWRSRGRWQH
ncbi:MAG: hypothetical protein NTW40_13915, partial [Acidobacteria bacterium]|nr:hypothetical protein [Acidobacteriota bacterium]